VKKEAGQADVLVNNAAGYGSTKATTLLDIGDETWNEVHQTNVLGPFRLIRGLFAEAHKAGKPGNIINVLSGSGFLPVPTPLACPYGVSKAALWMMTRYLALSLAPHIRVNALVPGVVTPSGEPRNNVQAALVDQIPLGRLGKPGEIAGAALYLASNASTYTSGEVIFCNGGRAW
jgi:NAD(P)-dependent dehydrogenase (short-subunit alcohol dehydrogenase family)